MLFVLIPGCEVHSSSNSCAPISCTCRTSFDREVPPWSSCYQCHWGEGSPTLQSWSDTVSQHGVPCWLCELWLGFTLAFLASLFVAIANFLLLQFDKAPWMCGWPASIFTAEPSKTVDFEKTLTVSSIARWSEPVFPWDFISGDIFIVHFILNDSLDVLTGNFWLIVWPVGNRKCFTCELHGQLGLMVFRQMV